MKNLKLKNSSYQHLEKAFKEWVDILGYSSGMQYYMQCHVREFLHFLETNNINQITTLQQKHYKEYFTYISTRSNQRRGGGLSNNSLNKQIQTLEKFYEFLIHKGVQHLPPVTLRQLKLERKEVEVLTQEEIQELYKATNNESDYYLQEIFNARDRAMLTVFYSCGLRRNEGVNLSIDDINFDTRIIHVRKGKNYKERLVPFSKTSLKYLQEWIYDYRIQLIKSQKEGALFIGNSGKPINGGSLYRRFKQIQQLVENAELRTKEIGLHTLRHSIATHLLQNGMELQKIQRFLGHASLETTKIYTHLIQKDASNI
tara:strand:+ start:2982 stop:3923 length:942 start_codon:yes stop_codon:yes gene_type:complete